MDLVNKLVRDLVEKFNPRKVILFSRKTTLGGETAAFKLCVIADTEKPQEMERRIYLQLACDIPFDVLVYGLRDWEKKRGIPGAFAQRIDKTGCVLYE